MVKSRLSTEEGKALDWYAKFHNYRFMMTIFPDVNFRNRETGEPLTVNMMLIVDEYKKHKEENQKTMAQEKKRIQNDEKWGRRYSGNAR